MEWYISRGSGQEGPFQIEDLRRFAQDGSLGASHHAWHPGLPEWIFVADVPGILTPPPLPTQMEVGESRRPIVTNGPFLHPVRPWVRFWARTLDTYMFALCVGFVLGVIAPWIFGNKFSELVLGVLIAFSWCFVEALCLSTFKTTPGKWLFRTKLYSVNPAAFDYGTVLKRAFNVWVRGVGCGIPFVAFVTHIVAYKRLTESGKTSWDTELGYSVIHDKIGAARIVCAVVFFILVTAIIGAAK